MPFVLYLEMKQKIQKKIRGLLPDIMKPQAVKVSGFLFTDKPVYRYLQMLCNCLQLEILDKSGFMFDFADYVLFDNDAFCLQHGC